MNQDGNDQNEIMLLDANGCPTEGQIMGPLAKCKGEAKDLVANFDAFKFPSSEVGPDPTTLIQRSMALTQILLQMVQFRALVTPCMPRCQPVECVYQDFYGGDNTRITRFDCFGTIACQQLTCGSPATGSVNVGRLEKPPFVLLLGRILSIGGCHHHKTSLR